MKRGIYRHYKGNLYELVDVANHSETLEKMVIYRALYGECETWARPVSMWDETVEHDGKKVSRFEYVGDQIDVEKSCGAVIWRMGEDGIQYLIIHQKGSGTWSFPKGHMEKGESKRKAAEREIYEEVSLKADIDDGFEMSVAYKTKRGKLKFVYLFVAQADGEIETCPDEVITHLWADKKTVLEHLPKVGYTKLLDAVEDYIRENYQM